jgi:hypothetical protein
LFFGCRGCGAFDEGGGETEFVAEGGFAGGHFAIVGFVIFAGEVEEAVEDEDFDLVGERVAVGGGLPGGGFERDGEVAGVLGGEGGGRGKAEDVGRFIFAAESFVEVAEGRVVGEEDVDLAWEADCGAGAVEESRKSGR